MKQVIGYLLDYQRKYFDWKVYLTIALFLGVCIAINYHLNFEDDYIDPYHGSMWHALWMFLFQAFPFLGVCIILLAFEKVDNWVRNKDFWFRLVLGFGLLGLDRGFYGLEWIRDYVSRAEFRYLYISLNWAAGIFISVIPFLLVYWLIEKQDNPKIWYGLSLKKFDPKPYLIMLLITAVIIGLGSFIGDIKNYYPRFLHASLDQFLSANDWERWQAIVFYELCYGSNFISVELFFRGYLIYAFSRILGPYVVLPMVCSYCFLHFGKPLGESISSIFGGYVLGIISMNSRNIWGGIFIHLGVAWLMELFGWLQQ